MMKANQNNEKPLTLSQLHGVKPAVKSPGLPEPIPELLGLKAGDKQGWHNAHLDDILSDFERFGPEWTMARYRMAESTLGRVIARAEKHHRKSYSLADKAMNKSKRNEVNIDQLTSGIQYLANLLSDHIEQDELRWNDNANLLQVISIEAARSARLQRIEPDDSLSLHKEYRANSSFNLPKVDRLRTRKVDTSCIEVDRYTVIDTEEPGRTPLLPGPKKTRLSPHQRYQASKARRWRRV